MCGFWQAGRQWLQSGCSGCRLMQGNSLTILSMGSLLEGFPKTRPGHPWHQPGQEVAGPSGTMTEVESTDVVYKIRQWSLPGAAVMLVLNVSSRVNGLELDDKALLESYAVLQEGILCDVFSQKCSAAWQGAPGQRLTVAIMLPGRQMADDWLDFMLSQRNLWPTFTTKGAPTEVITEKTVRKERRRLQAKHLWMEVKLSWNVLTDRMYTVRNYISCYSTGLPGAAKGIPMKKKHTVDMPTERSRHGGNNAKSGCCITNANVRHWSWTLKTFCMHSGARKRKLVWRLMHIWNIAQRGGKQERALTSSSDDVSCRM